MFVCSSANGICFFERCLAMQSYRGNGVANIPRTGNMDGVFLTSLSLLENGMSEVL